MARKVFNLTDKHIALLNRFYISYNNDCEYGAPEVNPKRPYGNSYVVGDMAEILKVTIPEHSPVFHDEYDKFCEDMNKLHQETAIALQIVLQTKSFDIGQYISCENYSTWKKVGVDEEIAKLEESIELKRRQLEEDEYQLQTLRNRK